jgi:hypothetical protein
VAHFSVKKPAPVWVKINNQRSLSAVMLDEGQFHSFDHG